jgi:hypothetical protein
MIKTKKILTIALAAVVLTTASVALAGEALAKGGKSGGGKGGGRGGKHHHHHFHRGYGFYSAPVVVDYGCWKWINYKKVWVCY